MTTDLTAKIRSAAVLGSIVVETQTETVESGKCLCADPSIFEGRDQPPARVEYVRAICPGLDFDLEMGGDK